MAKTWYPVIDYLECVECGACVQNCSHGVYDKSRAPSPVVIKPAGCIDHCHGCGNICPQGAITYVGDNTGWAPPHGRKPEEPEQGCCCSEQAGAACSCTGIQQKQITVDFLYLDLNTCERCMATDATLIEAIRELSDVLKTLGYEIAVNKVNITTREMAEQYRFLSSPTIRVNGEDICTEVKENHCRSCGDICGDNVDCRVFVYDGREYEQPPKAMIVDGILKSIYAPRSASEVGEYRVPENLETFFAGIKVSTCCEGQCSCSGDFR